VHTRQTGNRGPRVPQHLIFPFDSTAHEFAADVEPLTACTPCEESQGVSGTHPRACPTHSVQGGGDLAEVKRREVRDGQAPRRAAPGFAPFELIGLHGIATRVVDAQLERRVPMLRFWRILETPERVRVRSWPGLAIQRNEIRARETRKERWAFTPAFGLVVVEDRTAVLRVRSFKHRADLAANAKVDEPVGLAPSARLGVTQAELAVEIFACSHSPRAPVSSVLGFPCRQGETKPRRSSEQVCF